MSRPDIELALDLRSWEHVVILAPTDGDDERKYPPEWVRPTSQAALHTAVASDCVVIIDRVDVSKSTLAAIGQAWPAARLVAFIPSDRTQEIAMRRLVTSTFPWHRTWDFATASGKAIVFEGICGAAYDRDTVVDMRPVDGA